MGCNTSKTATPLLPETLVKMDNDTTSSDVDSDTAMKNHATELLAQEHYTEAYDQYQKLLDARMEKYGDSHLLVADAHVDLGLCCKVGGHPLLAWKYYKEAMKMRIELLGEESVQVADLYDCLGSVLSDLDKPKEAIYHHRMALQIHEKLNADAATMAKSESSSSFRKVSDRKLATAGMIDSGKTAGIHWNLGNCYSTVKMWEDALKHLEKALAGFNAAAPAQNSRSHEYDIAECYISLGVVHQKQQQWEDGFSFHEMAYLAAMSIDGPTQVLTFRSQMNMGICREGQEQYVEALELLQKSLVSQIAIHGEYNLETATCLYHIAECMIAAHGAKKLDQAHGAKKLDQAIMYYQRAETALLQTVGERHRMVYEVFSKLRKYYKTKGNSIKAAEYKEKASNVKKVLRGEREPSVPAPKAVIGSSPSLRSINTHHTTDSGGNDSLTDTQHATVRAFERRSVVLDGPRIARAAARKRVGGGASGAGGGSPKSSGNKGVSFGTNLTSAVIFKVDSPSGEFELDSLDDSNMHHFGPEGAPQDIDDIDPFASDSMGGPVAA